MQIENPYIQYMYSYPHKTAYKPLWDMDVKAYLPKLKGQENSLYFHIPFCQYKCGYCNLFSVAGQTERMMEDYVDAMERQAKQLADALPEGIEFSDLTLGGGTPLILPMHLLERVFWIAKEYFGFCPEKHWVVVETSPNQTTREKLELLKEQGVNRISIGVQSFQERELEVLHRFHTAASAKEAIRLIQEVAFDCVNVDLIYGVPEQSMESLGDSLKQAVSFAPEELFVYPLYVKPGTYLYQQGVKQAKDAMDMYRYARNYLKEMGYHPDSMRRFVKRESVFPRNAGGKLCGFGNTLSIGCGGRSYIGNLHFCTPYAVQHSHCMKRLDEYIKQQDYMKISYGFLLSQEEQRRRYVIKHILFGKGINLEDYHKHFGSEVQLDYPQLGEWMKQGYAVKRESSIGLTEEGFVLSDYLGPQLISPMVAQRMRNWRESDV